MYRPCLHCENGRYEKNYCPEICTYGEEKKRLAAYEDTGLTPDVCAEYKKFEDEAVGKGVTFKRIVELMNAEAEGRLVVLPCKVGDTLYITEPRFYNYKKHEGIQHGVCRGYELDDRWGWITKVELDEGEPHTLYFYNFSAFGKTVFLSHEEAEAALKGGAE